MDTSDPDIEFDQDGACNHCRAYEARVQRLVHVGERGEKKLHELVSRIKEVGKNQEYDCVIGVSGGVDSTFIAYRAKQLGLRPLAVHVDNGWDSELSVHNIERAMKKLDIDLYTHVLDWEEFKDIQLSFIKASVLNWEIPTDHAYSASVFRVACDHKIRFILHGGNMTTEGILPVAWGYANRDFRLIKGIQKRFGSVPMVSYPLLTLTRYFYYTRIRRIKYVYILNYGAYHKQNAIGILQKELGWQYYGGKHYESIYTRFYQGYVLPKKFHIDKRRAHLSTMICSGQIGRDEALQELQTDPYPAGVLDEDKLYVLKKLGLSEEEFEHLLALPVKSEASYPSLYYFFRTVRFLKRYTDRLYSFTGALRPKEN
jgi:N-acetyl sugar amidotransferase